jgi:hypothetical protein
MRRARGNALTIVAAVAAAGGVLWAGIATLDAPPSGNDAKALASGGGSGIAGASGTTKLPTAKKRRAPTTTELRGALAYLNLTPTMLAAAGVSAQETTVVVGNAKQYLTDNPEELSGADSSFHVAQAENDRLALLVQQGQSTQNDRAAFEIAQSTLAAAKGSRDAALTSLRAAAVAGLSQAKQDTLATVRANLNRELPVQYLVTSRSDEDWVALREALANDRQSTARQVDPDPTCHQRLLDANAVPAASAASLNLTNLLADVTTAFNTAVTGG